MILIYSVHTGDAFRLGAPAGDAMAQVLFINDVLSISARVIETPDQLSSSVLDIEVETAAGRRVLSLTIAIAHQLQASLDHVLKGRDLI